MAEIQNKESRNEEQEQAILHQNGPMMVIAGPGSGKTYVITKRVEHLTKKLGVREENILVITFTKAAANEMKERYLKMIGQNMSRVDFGTFHAIFFMILKAAYGLTGNNILREDVKRKILREIIYQLKVTYEDEADFISEVTGEISMLKSEKLTLSNYHSITCSDEVFGQIYERYQERLRAERLIDFDDMLVMCHDLFLKRPDILKLWQKKYEYILVDEFQDINRIQYEIVRMLASPEDNLFIVGDDDQSIYRFRGAKPEIMMNFAKDYKDAKRVTLARNYRSSKQIVEAAKRLITNNRIRFAKDPISVRGAGLPVKIRIFGDEKAEYKELVDMVVKLNEEGIPVQDMAVLLRTNQGAGGLVHKLMEYNIPFTMKDRIPNVFEHWVALDVLAYIRLANGTLDRNQFLRIMNRPVRYISRDAISGQTISFDDLKDYYEDKMWMLDRIDQFEYDLGMLSDTVPYAAVQYIRRGIGYEDFLKDYAIERHINLEDLMDVLDEITESTRGFQTMKDWFTFIEEYKQTLQEKARQQNKETEGSLTISTMHGSKGLEYEVVFIVDANEGVTPHKKAVLDTDLEEERRLFYVAMTRAKSRLFIYSTKKRFHKEQDISRYITEVCEKEETSEKPKEVKNQINR